MEAQGLSGGRNVESNSVPNVSEGELLNKERGVHREIITMDPSFVYIQAFTVSGNHEGFLIGCQTLA